MNATMPAPAELIEQLWHTYYSRVANHIGKVVNSYGQRTVEDLVSSVFLRALVAIKNGNGPGTEVEAWLIAIARTVCLDYWRKKRYTTFVDWETLVDRPLEELTVDEQVERMLLAEKVHSAIRRLEGRQGQATLLRMDGYSNQEIAETLGTTVGAIKQVNLRANNHLSEWLKEAA